MQNQASWLTGQIASLPSGRAAEGLAMTTARDTYLGSMTSTASPARLLVLLYDRLVLDLRRAVDLGEARDYLGAGRQLMHAQEIVLELQGSLRVDAWDGAVAAFAASTPSCTRRWCGPMSRAT